MARRKIEIFSYSGNERIVNRENTFAGILDILNKQRDFVEPPYHGPQPNYSYGPKVKGSLVSDSDDPKVKGNVDDDRKRAFEMHPEDETEELQLRKKSGLGANRTLRSWVTYKDPIITDWAEHIRKHEAGNLVRQKLEEEGLPEKQQSVQEEEKSMASSSSNENNQNMVDSAKAAHVKIIPYEHTFDGVLEVLMRQRNYVEPPNFCPDVQSNVEEDPASDTGDHEVKANVGGDRNSDLEMHTKPEIEELPVRKKSRLMAKDTMWGGLLTHEGLIRAGSAYLARIEALTNLQKDQTGVVVPQKLEDGGVLEKQQNVQ